MYIKLSAAYIMASQFKSVSGFSSTLSANSVCDVITFVAYGHKYDSKNKGILSEKYILQKKVFISIPYNCLQKNVFFFSKTELTNRIQY